MANEISRRNFIKRTAIGGLSLAASSSKIFFFPKPANAYSINYLLSQDGRSDAVFQNFLLANVTQGVSNTIPSSESAVISAVETVQQELVAREFTMNPTPFAQRLNSPNNPLWGKQRQEEVGPNPGFGTVQIISNQVSAISFTGSTTAGIDSAIRILGTDEHLDPRVLDYSLIPVEEQFEDWGTWSGDLDPHTGQISSSSVTRYGTRYGHVIRQYQVVEPGVGGFGVINLFIDAGSRAKAQIEVRVDFA